MAEVWSMGEMLVEIMRPQADMPLRRPGSFLGPFPSGAPAIFIDTVPRLGHSAGIVGGVGGQAIAACNIWGSDSEIIGSRLQHLAQRVQHVAQEISGRMGFIPSRRPLVVAPDATGQSGG